MERIIFSKNEKSETIANLTSAGNKNTNSGSLKIDKGVLDEACSQSMCSRVLYEYRGVFNTWYKFNHMVILKVESMKSNDEALFIFDNAVNRVPDDKLMPIDWLFGNGHIVYLKKPDKKNRGRYRAFVTMNGKTVNVSTAVKVLSGGISLEAASSLEAHHMSYDFDNRVKNIKIVTPEEHTRIHQIETYKSHQLQVHITSVEELIAFINYMHKKDAETR